MNREIGIIASDLELKERIVEMFREEVEEGQILIEILDQGKIDSQGIDLERRGAKVIIGRSGSYRHTVGKVSVPVIHLKMTTTDILQAISKGKKYGKNLVLVISDLDYFDYETWKDLINANLILERFKSKDEIYDRVHKYKDKDVVILGGGIPCSFARNLKMESVFINASKESIYESVRYARELVAKVYKQRYNNKLMQNVLDEVRDATLVVSKEGRVKLYNRKAEEILKRPFEEVIDRYIERVLPDFSFLIGDMEEGLETRDKIIKFRDTNLNFNASNILIDGQLEGILCTFQDTNRVQNLEKRIRYQLSNKGHVAKYSLNDMVAESPTMRKLIARAKKVSKTDNTVIIYGESGTGKEMLAQGIHRNSMRRSEPFVAINCAAISPNLLESELFGYEEGAFTGARKGGKPGLFEMAHGGTIFLDEINSIPFELQGKLLRIIEERESMRLGSDYVIPLDIRIITASNEDLMDMVMEGQFRADLFYRLNIIELDIPPIRNRREDIIPIFKLSHRDLTGEDLELSSEIEKKLLAYQWPGNGREIKNMVERYIIFGELDLDQSEMSKLEDEKDLNGIMNLKEINDYVEEQVINSLLKGGFTKTEVSSILGISRTTLWKKLNDVH